MQALEKATIVNEEIGYEVEITVLYNEWEKVKYYLEKSNILIIDVKYNEKIVSKIEVTEKEKNKIKELIDECSLKIEKLNTIKQKNIRKNIEI